jgi:hypothetical protein
LRLRRAISCSPMRNETAQNSCRTAIDGLFGAGSSGAGVIEERQATGSAAGV